MLGLRANRIDQRPGTTERYKLNEGRMRTSREDKYEEDYEEDNEA